jgi:hypothetical protein
LFCIRLHFVLKERIGVEQIGAKRFLTIDEIARSYLLRGRNFETTANTRMISRQGSHRKLLVEFAVIGLAHCGHVIHRERDWPAFVPEPSRKNQSGLKYRSGTRAGSRGEIGIETREPGPTWKLQKKVPAL